MPSYRLKCTNCKEEKDAVMSMGEFDRFKRDNQYRFDVGDRCAPCGYARFEVVPAKFSFRMN